MTEDRRLVLATLAVIAIFLTVDWIWLQNSSVAIGRRAVVECIATIAALSVTALAAFAARYRLRSNTRLGRLAWNIAYRLEFLSFLALFATFAFAMTTFTYLAAATARPLYDEYFAAIDKMLGFDWLTVLSQVNDRPLLGWVMIVAYHSLAPQIYLVMLLLAGLGARVRLAEFLANIAVAGLVTALVMALLPAAGPYVYFAPDPHLYSSLTAKAGIWHLEHLTQLRSGEPFVLDRPEGLVVFPSMHASVAVFLPYALRDIRWLFAPALCLNLMTILAAIPEGGHYLIDVLAGLLVAAFSICVLKLLLPRSARLVATSPSNSRSSADSGQ